MIHNRRSTRLSISIPVFMSGVDAEGNEFRECVRTLIVNKHGGKIATPRHLALGTEVALENPALGVVAKACVAWLGEQHHEGQRHHVGLQLHEAQNVWGIEFPPEDWQSTIGEDEPAAGETLPGGESATPNPEAGMSSLAGEEIAIRLLQELQEAADAHAREFQERVKQLANRVGAELEIEWREQVAAAKEHEVGPLEEQIKILWESLRAAAAELQNLEAMMLELKGGAPAGIPSPARLNEAHHQLTALSNSVVERMNLAAETGLREYRSMLQKENQENAARLRQGAEQNSRLRPNPPTKP